MPVYSQRISPANAALLDSLDVVLSMAPEYDAVKESSLERVKQRVRGVSDPEERYWLFRELYQGYSAYDSDSALKYSSEALAIARDLNRRQWVDDVLISRAYVVSATGMFEDARRTLAQINVGNLSPAGFLKYIETHLFMQTHADQYADVRNSVLPYSDEAGELLVQLCRDLPVNDPDYYWMVGWNSLRTRETAIAMIPRMEELLSDSKFSTRADARHAWMLSALYNKAGDQDNRLKFLILSAMADVRGSVREIASLEEIARYVYEAGDLEHANSYISYCIHCANLYRNRVRIVGMANLQYQISEAYEAQSRRQKAQNQRLLTVLIALLIMFAVALAVIFVQLRRIRRRGMQLDNANASLSERVSELQDAREQLNAANGSLKELYASLRDNVDELSRINEANEKYIADIFSICSEDISKLDEFRKKINRMIMAGRFDEVRQLTKNPELSHAELKELYDNFDRIFLQIYPDFVSAFNSLLRPGEQIVLKKGEMLNTELRIYALVRLGLNDSVKISQFLHCSVQTVYNTRMRIRNKSDIPRDEFVDRVRALCKSAY